MFRGRTSPQNSGKEPTPLQASPLPMIVQILGKEPTLPQAQPQPIIARILNYMDRNAIPTYARLQDNITYQWHHIMIYPDYTKRVQPQHQFFTAAKQCLWDLKLQYILLYPACLSVVFNSQTLFCGSLEDIFRWTVKKVTFKPSLCSDASAPMKKFNISKSYRRDGER
ncbi:hypothetical protein NDU88_008164 [Pleurodeles waltl]|uniref:Uncharacterized protein n=1 Tax=Pleurodeles waltl TaxID=8319 RepID=A0AAV7NX21_PLEWA|nr:hypothetical protein NDU88_008164 [Pleurodeles waltl]